MEEIKNEEIKNEEFKVSKEKENKMRDKRNTFTLIYILVGIFIIAVLGMLIYALLVTK
mgnify:CR=1 FL=1